MQKLIWSDILPGVSKLSTTENCKDIDCFKNCFRIYFYNKPLKKLFEKWFDLLRYFILTDVSKLSGWRNSPTLASEFLRVDCDSLTAFVLPTPIIAGKACQSGGGNWPIKTNILSWLTYTTKSRKWKTYKLASWFCLRYASQYLAPCSTCSCSSLWEIFPTFQPLPTMFSCSICPFATFSSAPLLLQYQVSMSAMLLPMWVANTSWGWEVPSSGWGCLEPSLK